MSGSGACRYRHGAIIATDRLPPIADRPVATGVDILKKSIYFSDVIEYFFRRVFFIK
jgi:hypothetical protein